MELLAASTAATPASVLNPTERLWSTMLSRPALRALDPLHTLAIADYVAVRVDEYEVGAGGGTRGWGVQEGAADGGEVQMGPQRGWGRGDASEANTHA